MWQTIVDTAGDWSGTVVIASVGVIVVILTDRLLWQRHRKSLNSQMSLAGPLITFTLVGIVAVSTILSLPIGDSARGQLLGLLGLLVTAAVALSSTTFLGNAMAGIMLRAVRNFRLGDYVRVGEFAGRISDRGILHTELQTEDSDLTTLPNLYLVTHPVTVLRPEGTVVSATVSLGYDIDHHDIERYLINAATRSGLTDAFVRVEELGDFSITYRAAGILTEVKHLLSARSNIRKAMLDALHEAGVEIVSPNFTNQRRLAEDVSFVPGERKTRSSILRSDLPDARIFDKAELAEAKAKLRKQIAMQSSHVEELTKERQASTLEAERLEIEHRLDAAKERLADMMKLVEEAAAEETA
jgi:small conductance mechanosensitive channel